MKIMIFSILFVISSNVYTDSPFKGEYPELPFLEIPLPLLPVNHAIHVSQTPYFEWITIGGVGTQFQLQVTTLSDLFFVYPVIDIEGIQVPYYQVTVKNILNNSTEYKWRVKSKCGRESSLFSLVFIFITDN